MTAIRKVPAHIAYRSLFLWGVLLAICFASGLWKILMSQELRLVHAQLATIEKERDDLQAEWTQLLLEHSVLASEGHIDKTARDVLNMTMPKDVVIVKIP